MIFCTYITIVTSTGKLQLFRHVKRLKDRDSPCSSRLNTIMYLSIHTTLALFAMIKSQPIKNGPKFDYCIISFYLVESLR